MTTDMTPCVRYRAWLASSGRIPCPDVPSNPFEWAYLRESSRLYEEWVHRAWCNFNRKAMPKPSYAGFTDPAFDEWLSAIYLKQSA